MSKKMTKKDYFTAIMEKYPLSADEKAFIDHELELLAKKNASEKKPTAKQAENEAIKANILDAMEPNRLYTISELLKVVPGLPEDFTNQRMSALVRQMLGVSVNRVEEKRKAYFQKIVD